MKNHVHKEAPPGMKHHRNYGKYLYTAFLAFTLIACNVQPVMAAILNGLGFIMAYITPFFAGGQWNG